MSPASRTPIVAGVTLVALAVCLIVFMGGRADFGDDNPFVGGEVAGYLTAIHKHQVLTRTAFAFAIIVDGVLVFVMGAAMYDLFRDRSRLLAALTFAGFVGNGAVSGVADAVGLVLTFVAEDFVRGGPEGAAAAPAVLALGRAFGIAQRLLTYVQLTPFALAQLGLGSLLLFAPSGAVNPPRLLGWIALVSGAAGFLTWGVFLTDFFFAFLVVNALGTLVMLFGLGFWLIHNRHLAPPR